MGRMCPGACTQDTFLMQSYNRWEDKKENKTFNDISNTQNVGLGGVAYIYILYYGGIMGLLWDIYGDSQETLMNV